MLPYELKKHDRCLMFMNSEVCISSNLFWMAYWGQLLTDLSYYLRFTEDDFPTVWLYH